MPNCAASIFTMTKLKKIRVAVTVVAYRNESIHERYKSVEAHAVSIDDSY